MTHPRFLYRRGERSFDILDAKILFHLTVRGSPVPEREVKDLTKQAERTPVIFKVWSINILTRLKLITRGRNAGGTSGSVV